ncbi:MAG TPA: hypothetical protein DEA08_12965 [Planctomycetes bacterium]|nr:hypothetical protein [Planctomycetota bacterium]
MRSLITRTSAGRISLALMLALAAGGTALAQPGPGDAPPPSNEGRLFGMEFEFAGRGNRIVDFREMPWENYEKLMREVVRAQGGDPSTIRRVDFTKPTSNLERYPTGERPLFRAEWTDAKGRKWMIEPEYVSSTGLDGYELVTPPLADPKEVERVLNNVRNSGLVREGLKSGVHLTIDARDLVRPNGDARALANLIVMHENMEPMLRRLFNPVRGGGHANRFARSIAVDHPELLEEIDRLRPEERTKERLSEMFRSRNGREATLHEVDPMNPDSYTKLWKYRSMNLAKALNVNELHNGNSGVVEFRMFDLNALSNPEAHRLQAELYRAMIERAKTMAENGETVRYQKRAAQPAGEDPSLYNTPQDPNEARAKAREMIERLGLDPNRFETLIESNVARPRHLASEAEFRGALEALPTGRVTHNGQAFSYGFELEGSGEGFSRIARPKDAEVNSRWDTMTDSQKAEYYRQKVGADRHAVKQHFELDLQRFPFLDPNWKVEGTGNWEIRSKPVESISEITAYMRQVKELTGKSGKGFHLHMRDNGADWEMLRTRGSQFADFIERSSNWVWLERARRLGTMTSMKSWSNARMKTSELETLSQIKSTGRATVRVTVPHGQEFIDLEIRGFTKDVDNIERLAKIYTHALKTGNFGPWKHTENPLAMNGQGNAPESLRFVDHVERYLKEVEGRTMTPEMRRVVDGLQHDYISKSKGNARTYSTNVATALLPWDREASISESARRDMKFAREEMLRSIVRTANGVMSGNYGLELSTANEASLQRHLGLSEAEARAVVEYRAAGGQLNTPEDLVRALSRGAEAGRLSRLTAVDLNNAALETQGMRDRLGLNAEAAANLTTYRNTMDVVDALERAGVPEAKVLELIDRTGALDLMSNQATVENIRKRTGLSEAAARKIIEYRDAGNTIGRNGSYQWASYDANRAATQLREAGVLTEAQAEKIKLHTSDIKLETAQLQDLQKRFGLNEATAERVLWLRDAHKLDLEGLKRAGLSEAEAKRVMESSTQLDPRTTTLEALAERTGMSAEALASALRAEGLDLRNASKADLMKRLGITAANADKLIEARGNGNSLSTVEQLREAGLSEAVAKKVNTLAKGVDLGNTTLEELRKLGMNEAEAKRLIEARERARTAEGLDYNEITRQVRYKTKKWAREGQLSEALLRSLLPRANPEMYSVANEATTTNSENFSRTRAGTGPFQASKLSYETVSGIFEAIREGTGARLAEKINESRAAGNNEALRLAESGVEKMRNLKLEILETNAISAGVSEGKVRLSTGLFNEIYARAEKLPPGERAAFRMRVLGLIMGHEAAHASGIRAERVADMEAVRIVEKSRLGAAGNVTEAEVRTTLDVFERPLGSGRIDNFFNRLRNLLRYGTPTGRRDNLERTARGEVDPFEKYRRADGTLKWKEITRDRAMREGVGLLHFGLALFLKEVAVVTATGDRARIEEFFDGLMTTDFYKHYGLFVAGARVSEVAYTRYLQRYVKPRFVNGVLKTNLVLAAGMALPLIAEGRFEGKAFAISVASLGLSSAAVKSGVAGIKWVMNLGKARQAGLLGNAARAGRLARLGGWFYTAAELAVILYVAETVDREVNAELARRQAREALSEAGQRLLATANASPSPERLREASEQYREAYNGYRDHLYQPLELQEAIFADRLQRYARQAKLLADRREAALAKVAGNAALERSLSERHGSLEAYAASLTQDEEAKLERELSLYVDSYNTNREAALEDVYRGNRREGSWLAGLEHREWLLSGAPTGASNDPFAERGDVFANWGRSRARSSFEDLLGSGSRNRLQTYEDEQELLQALEQSLRARGQGELARVLADERAKVARLAQLDRGLMDEGTIDTRTAKGIAERIEEVEAERGD